MDDLAENNTKQIAEIRHSISLLLAIEKQSSKYFPLKGHISFIKGKVLKESGEKRLPYLSLDSLNGSQEFSFSYDGIEAKKTDVLMLMDGASSGAVYFGNEGYVGSTFAIIRLDESVDSYVLFAVLREYQDTIKERTTGSAIPHADKHLIEELGYPCLASSNAEKLHSLIDRECNLLRQKRILNKIKETLLNKYF